jgi:phospholipase/carboxylesterase
VTTVLPVFAMRAWLVAAVVACTPTSSATNEEKNDVSDKPTSPTAATPSVTSPRVLSIGPREAPRALVVLLHGLGADAESFHDVARALAPTLPKAEFLTLEAFHPFDQGGPGRQWFSIRGVTEDNRPARVREAGSEVSRWIDLELDKRTLAHDRVVVVGFSQGAIVAAWLAVHRSPRPSGVIMFSGRVADDDVPVAGSNSTPVLLAHGAEDPIIPISLVDPSARILEAWGAKVTKRIYPGLGHQIDPRELRDAKEFLETTLARK